MATQQYYLKDKTLQLWREISTRVNGMPVRTYEKIVPYKNWAYYRLNNGNIKVSSGALVWEDTVENAIFVISRLPSGYTVKAKDLIVYNHKIYTITLVDDYEGYKDDLKISATLADNQNFDNYDGLIDD